MAPVDKRPQVFTLDDVTASHDRARLSGVAVGTDIMSRGFVYGSFPGLTLENNEGRYEAGPGSGKFMKELTGLSGYTLYYFRAYASNPHGDGYGEVYSFMTDYNNCGLLFNWADDFYATVIMGDQCLWRSNSYSWIPFSPGTVYDVNGIPVFFKMGTYDEYKKYGAYYSDSVLVETETLCLPNWHFPTVADWDHVISAFGGWEKAGGAMKITEADSWDAPNLNATNQSGFSAYPTGYAEFLPDLDTIVVREQGQSAYFLIADMPEKALKLSASSEAVEIVDLPGPNIMLSCRCFMDR